MKDDPVDPAMPPELRALREASAGRELTPDEKRRYAELAADRLKEVMGGIQLAASPITAEVDQMVAAVRELTDRLETLGEQRGRVSLADASGDATRQLACALLRATELLVHYGDWTWDPPDLEQVRSQLTEVDDSLTRAEEHCAESIAEFEREFGREDVLTGEG
jgi:hypothetical protein